MTRLKINRLSKAMHKRRRIVLLNQMRRELVELERGVVSLMGMFEPVPVPDGVKLH